MDTNTGTTDLLSIYNEGVAYCREWVNLPKVTLKTMSQDVNPYPRPSFESFAWEMGFWDELRKVIIGMMQPPN